MNKKDSITQHLDAIYNQLEDLGIAKEIIAHNIEELTTLLETVEPEKPTIIRVPDCIKITGGPSCSGDGLAITFNNDQRLFISPLHNKYCIGINNGADLIPTQLIKIDPSEKVNGGTYFNCSKGMVNDWKDMLCYYIKRVEDFDINIVNGFPKKYGYKHPISEWYKVEQLEETE